MHVWCEAKNKTMWKAFVLTPNVSYVYFCGKMIASAEKRKEKIRFISISFCNRFSFIYHFHCFDIIDNSYLLCSVCCYCLFSLCRYLGLAVHSRIQFSLSLCCVVVVCVCFRYSCKKNVSHIAFFLL